ncbi:hypothetical protein [Bradyrhizobium cosmicum]|uniref:hypothetical protein n=1 Tax=Bradyrhizobium cosmicum TaxID=1404864 RepID=UPI0028E4B63B|nr:hypothetical protein [Bradyrhizobium cosmicum]
MTALASYSTGTVSVSAGGTTVTGVGTIWSGTNVRPGDILQVGNFQTVISDVTDTTHLVIPPWGGGAQAGATYKIWQVSPQRFAGAQGMQAVNDLVSALNTSGYFVFVDIDETVPDPSLGDDGQYAFQPTTGKMWAKVSGVWSYLGIYKGLQFKGAWSGATAYTVNDVVTLSGSSYACVLDHTNHTPPDTTYWQLLASKGDQGIPGPTGPAGAGDLLSTNNLSDLASAATAANNLGVVRYGGSQSLTAAQKVQAQKNTGVRELLTAARTYYVRSDGSNSNNGLANTSGGAFLTIQKAYDVISQTLDLGGFNVTIQCNNVAAFDGLALNTAWTGGGNATLDLGSGTINGTTNVINCTIPLPGIFTVQNGTLTSTTLPLINHTGTGSLNVGNITLSGANTGGFDMISATANAYIHFTGNIAFGVCSGWREIFYARTGGIIDLYGGFGQTMIMTGNMSWSDSFAYSEVGGGVKAVSGARTISTGGFTMTGKRYSVETAAFVYTQGGGANYFPGSIAGTIVGTGSYA